MQQQQKPDNNFPEMTTCIFINFIKLFSLERTGDKIPAIKHTGTVTRTAAIRVSAAGLP